MAKKPSSISPPLSCAGARLPIPCTRVLGVLSPALPPAQTQAPHGLHKPALTQPYPPLRCGHPGCPSTRRPFCSLGRRHAAVRWPRGVLSASSPALLLMRLHNPFSQHSHTNTRALPSLVHGLTSAHTHRNADCFFLTNERWKSMHFTNANWP